MGFELHSRRYFGIWIYRLVGNILQGGMLVIEQVHLNNVCANAENKIECLISK